jgi:hypothetical protein
VADFDGDGDLARPRSWKTLQKGRNAIIPNIKSHHPRDSRQPKYVTVPKNHTAEPHPSSKQSQTSQLSRSLARSDRWAVVVYTCYAVGVLTPDSTTGEIIPIFPIRRLDRSDSHTPSRANARPA